jgi:hypothetical protein
LFNWELRYDTERTIEEIVGLEKGSVLIYIPDESMGAKKYLGTRVELPIGWSDENTKSIENLKKEDFPTENREIFDIIRITREAITSKHEILWKLSVLIRDDAGKKEKDNVKHICEQWFSGAAPVSMVEFIAREHLELKGVSFTEIAESLNKSEAIPLAVGEKKSQLAMAVDKAKSLLSSQSNE